MHTENYYLRVNYFRKGLQKVGVNIFVHENLKSTSINLEYCKDHIIEACAVKLEFSFLNSCILTLCRGSAIWKFRSVRQQIRNHPQCSA
jgi:hypothetical protein